ncbi:MAG TPA: helix-turn-helix domain-containing protein [Bacillota bacterium]|nr:helix-turn-helix domain-containing protein [Bacillota bacterium]
MLPNNQNIIYAYQLQVGIIISINYLFITAEDFMLYYNSDCPVKATLHIIGGTWKSVIYRELYTCRICRFGKAKKGIPEISAKLLTEMLKELEVDGLISQTVYPEVPVRMEYALTSTERCFRKSISLYGRMGGTIFGKKKYNSPLLPSKTTE